MIVFDSRKFENLHILFWLIKDSCWMVEYRTLGAVMIIPTMYLAVYIVIKTVREPDFFVNLAVLFWISANSFWMLMEFFNDDKLKNWSLVPFLLGLASVGYYYLFVKKPANNR